MSGLADRFDKAGIKRFVFIRHANAAPPGDKKKGDYAAIHDWHKDDQMRPLTDKGKKQAAVSREKWFDTDIVLSTNKVVVTSGARRASETLQVMCEKKAKSSIFSAFCTSSSTVGMDCGMELVGSLHPAGIAPKCEELFDKNGYAPLAKFYAMDGGEAAFAEYADIVTKDLALLADRIATTAGTTISCFGHAVFLNAVAMKVAKEWGADAATVQKLTDLDLGEAEGIVIARAANGSSCTVEHKTVRPHDLW